MSRFIEAWLMLAWVDLRVSFTGYHYWQCYLTLGMKPHSVETCSKNTFSEMAFWQYVRDLIVLSETAARYHWRPMNCLRRCFTQQRILLRRNITSKLHIGVVKNHEQLKAHAWLSIEGRVINDTEDVVSLYTELQPASYVQLSKLLS